MAVLVDPKDLRVVLKAAAKSGFDTDIEWESFFTLAAKTSIKENWMYLDYGPRKIEVIKAWRHYTGLGLKEAKEAVETYPRLLPQPLRGKTMPRFAADLNAAGAHLKKRE